MSINPRLIIITAMAARSKEATLSNALEPPIFFLHAFFSKVMLEGNPYLEVDRIIVARITSSTIEIIT